MIRLENVSKFYTTKAGVTMGLTRINASFEVGEIVAIVGESGAGKSTLLNVITQMDSFDEGEIYYDDILASSMTQEEIERFRKENIGFIFQNYNLIDSQTVLDNAMLPLLLKGVDKEEAKEKALEVLRRVGLEEKVNNKATRLSGGQKQRLVIARAIISDNKVLVCDEPTGNLDSETSKEIINLIKEVSDGRLVLIVTHNYDRIKHIITRRIEVKDGSIIEDTKIKEANITKNQIVFSKDLHKLSFKRELYFGLHNLTSTPRKTILTLFVFIFMILAFAALYAVGLTVNYEEHVIDNNYRNMTENRVVIYDAAYNTLDTDKISKIPGVEKMVTNSFYEDNFLEVEMATQTYDQFFLDTNFSEDKLLYGRMPENNYEIVIGVDSLTRVLFNELEDTVAYIENIENHSSLGNDNSSINAFRIVGMYESSFYDSMSKKVADEAACVYGTEEFNKAFKYELTATAVNAYVNGYSLSFTAIPDEVVDPNQSNDFNENEITLFADQNMLDYLWENGGINTTIKIFGYEIKVDCESYKSNLISKKVSATLYIPYEKLIELVDNNVFMVSVYANHLSDIKHIISKCERLGYEATSPYNSDYVTVTDSSIRNTRIITTLLIVVLSILVYFILFFILYKIYQTKVKEYTLFRSLGANNRDIFLMTLVEFMTLLITSFILCLIPLLIVSLTSNFVLSNLFTYYEWYKVIVFFILVSLMTSLIAYRVYRRIFKYSIQTSLKKEAISND